MNDLVILALLLPGPKHGYQLKREAGIILGHEALHNNLVYPLLRRFTTSQWVSRKTVPGQRGQTRNQYSLTALGRKELLDQLNSFTEQDARSADAFRIRVSLFGLLKPEARARIFQLGFFSSVEVRAERALALVADEEDRRRRIVDQVAQVPDDAAAGQHPV